MNLTQLTIVAVFIAVSTAAITRNDPIREHPQSVVVIEGHWANFSCGIKLPGLIKWRIGDFDADGYFYNTAGNLDDVEGVTAERWSSRRVDSKKMLHETIRVLGTMELEGTPVQCMFVHSNNSTKKDSFSKFGLIHVNRLTTGSGEIY